MFGYSLTRPTHNQDYFYGIFDACQQFRCGIEGWHTESGPGVFEAVGRLAHDVREDLIANQGPHRRSSSERSHKWPIKPPSSSPSIP